MTECVVDASVAVKWYVPEVYSDNAARLLNEDCQLNGPDLLLPEFGNILRKKHVQNELGESDVRAIIRAISIVPLQIHSSQALLEGAVEIAMYTKRTVYDSLYLALAIWLKCPFLTADDRLVNALQATDLSAHLRHVRDY
jgi:predicted nucleic acid-binding protein